MANPLNYDPREVEDYIARGAMQRGIDPRVALRVWGSEGRHGYVGDQGSSFGPFQLHYGNVAPGGNKVGGLGDVFTRRTGLDARDPSTWRQQVDFSLDEAKRGGWGPWHGWKGPARAGMDGAQQNEPLAYTAREGKPFFPPLKNQQAQAQETPLQMEDFFAGRHLERPQAAPQAAPAPKTYQMEDFFAGEGPKTEPLPSSPVVESVRQAQVPAPEWGAGREFLRGAVSGFTGGMGDINRAGAAVRAGYEALTGQAPEGFFARRREIVNQLEAGRKAYEAENPMSAAISESVGAGVGTAAPLGLAAKGIGVGATALGKAAPYLEPGLARAGQFLGGKGEAFWGLPSKAVYGGLYGTGETALSQGLVPEEDRGDYLHGAGTGAAANVVLGTLGKPFSKILNAELNESLVPIAKKANEKYNLGVRAGQVARDMEVKNLDEMLVPQHVHDKQIQRMTEEISKEVGLGGELLSNSNITNKMEEIGRQIRNTIGTRPIPVRGGNGAYPQLVNDVNTIFSGVAGKINPGDPEEAVINNFLRGLRTAFSTGQMEGQMIQNYIGHNGRIANAFRNTGRAALNGVEHDLREAFLNAFEKAHPTAVSGFRDARNTYRKLAAIDDIVAGSESGYINPKALMRQVQKRRITGPLRELAEIGEHMPSITSTGAANVRGPSGLYREVAGAASVGVPLAQAVGASIPFGELVSKLATGKLLSEAAQSQVLRSPLLTYAKFNAPRMASGVGNVVGNVLLGAPTAMGAGVGGMER